MQTQRNHHITHLIIILIAVRFSLKDLEKAYEKTEDDIKAVQSVGQIIGEVMKQLDDDRCMYNTIHFEFRLTALLLSYCESLIGPTLCGLIPTNTSRRKIENGHPRFT